MSKIKEMLVNNYTEEDYEQKMINDMIDSEYKEVHKNEIIRQIIELKMIGGDNKNKIQKLQQTLDELNG